MTKTLPDTDRAAKIAGIHDFAHWLAANPSVPLPSLTVARNLHRRNGTEIENLATVRKLAADLGVETDERLDDRTVLRFPVGGYVTYELVTWHDGGRPGQPDPRDAELERLRAEVAQLRGQVGLDYSRVDDDPQVVRPHSPRVPLHIGVVEQGGELHDETPAEAATLSAAIRFSEARREAARLTGRTTSERLQAATLDLLHGQALTEDAVRARRADLLSRGETGRVTSVSLARFLAEKEQKRRTVAGPLTPAPIAAHYDASADPAEDVCACGEAFDGLDSLKRHIEAENAAPVSESR